jgi:hypothetical protein
MKTTGWWVMGGLVLLAGALGAANGAGAGGQGSSGASLVQVDGEHVVNMAAVTMAKYGGKEGNGQWYVHFRFMGEPGLESLVYTDENAAREAWGRIVAAASKRQE